MRSRTRINWLVMLLIVLGTLFILFPLYMTVTIALKNPE
ncbi:carbohydrate ABC transporter permease, partial [Clostridioides difficile]